MTVGLSSAAFFGRMDTEDQAAKVREFPVQCCEVFLQTGSEYTAAFGHLVRERLQGVNCVSVHAMSSQFESELFSIYHRQAEDALRQFEGVCAAGQAMGARYYVLHGRAGYVSPAKVQSIPNLQQTMARLHKTAASCGLEVLWENVSWCALRSVEDVLWVRQMLPEQRFVMDVKQAYRTGQDPQAMIRAMGDRLAHVHVLDQSGDGTLCLPGEGVTDWTGMAEALRSIGYGGAVILEPYERHTRDEDALRRSLAYLRQVFCGGSAGTVDF